MMRHWHIMAIVLMMAMVAVPSLVWNRPYPISSPDTLNHIEHAGNNYWVYPAEALSIIPIKFSAILGISAERAFLWFDVLVLILAAIAIYLLMAKLVNRWAGVMAVMLVFFCTVGIANLFRSGTIFDIVNTCIVLPLGILMLVTWIVEHRNWQLALTFILFTAYSALHPSAVYLAPTLLLVSTMLFISSKYRNIRTILPILVMLAVSITMIATGYMYLLGKISIPIGYAVNYIEFFTVFVKIALLILLGFGIIYIVLAKVIMPEKAKVLLMVLLCLSAVLFVLTFVQFSADPGRQGYTLATALALVTACLLGVIVKRRKELSPILMAVAVIGSIPVARAWLLGIGV